ncbi:hypothetical protein ACQPZG_04650 (plasmid) [Streptomyces sp. CA-294286]|uniref:hypothetical protein n=1 Tax=Streptomyces sp. CA-294286 TaxID=3240070 RepID=UPI003D939F08
MQTVTSRAAWSVPVSVTMSCSPPGGVVTYYLVAALVEDRDGGEPGRFALVGLDDDDSVVRGIEVIDQHGQRVRGRLLDVIAALPLGPWCVAAIGSVSPPPPTWSRPA